MLDNKRRFHVVLRVDLIIELVVAVSSSLRLVVVLTLLLARSGILRLLPSVVRVLDVDIVFRTGSLLLSLHHYLTGRGRIWIHKVRVLHLNLRVAGSLRMHLQVTLGASIAWILILHGSDYNILHIVVDG